MKDVGRWYSFIADGSIDYYNLLGERSGNIYYI